MSKHTPGPWEASPNGPQDGPQVPGTWKIEHGRQWISSQVAGKANARLIAAAPELLERLTDAEARLAVFSEWISREIVASRGTVTERNIRADCDYNLPRIRAAIARAEGKE